MNDTVKSKLIEYKSLEKGKCFALANWINLKNKKFSFTDALYCIYISSGGEFDEMTKIINQLTEKNKIQGRTQVYGEDNVSTIDIVPGLNGKLELIGYNPDKKPIAKGQHTSRNPKIFRKSDDQVNKTYRKSEEKIMNAGQEVRELFPGESNIFITHAMQAIKNYANAKKISMDKVISGLKKGRLTLKGEDYNDFEIVPNTNESRTIVISESMMNLLNEELEMTEYKFYNNVKSFLSELLSDPVNAKPSLLLHKYGITRSFLINKMKNLGMLEKDERIVDTDENGEPSVARMNIKYRIPKKDFKRNLRKLWIRLFERNLPQDNINEEGEGALSAAESGEVIQPLFPIQRRKMPTEVEESTTTSTAGNYEFDVPFPGDEETLARKNGVGGSVSVNKA